MKRYTFASKKMTVIPDTKEGWNGFVRELIEAKEKVELQHESLIRHQSGIAATLIGIIAVLAMCHKVVHFFDA